MWPFSKKVTSTSPTLKQRVTEFWNWYAANAERFYQTIEDKRCSDLQPEVSEAVDRWLPGMAWVFGPGENKHGHSFTLSGEGVIFNQFVAEYWLQQAPRLEGWTFYASRQASDGPGEFTLRLANDQSFKPDEFWVFPYVDAQAEKIDLSVWHPRMKLLDEKTGFHILFLMLDELLGEHGTQNWIGEIKFSEDQLKQSIPISELPELISQVEEEHGWKKYPPTETYSSYHLKDQDDEWLRSDTVAGTSRCFRLLREYFEAHGPCEHPLSGIGVDYVFVAVQTSFFPKGAEVDSRGKIEDEIIEALEAAGSGISLGGATGYKNCYMDFALYDGDRSIEIVKRILRRNGVPKGAAIRFFTSDRAKDVIAV